MSASMSLRIGPCEHCGEVDHHLVGGLCACCRPLYRDHDGGVGQLADVLLRLARDRRPVRDGLRRRD